MKNASLLKHRTHCHGATYGENLPYLDGLCLDPLGIVNGMVNCFIVKLSGSKNPKAQQRALRGNCISFMQQPKKLRELKMKFPNACISPWDMKRVTLLTKVLPATM